MTKRLIKLNCSAWSRIKNFAALLVLVFGSLFHLHAQTVSEEVALKVAKNFYEMNVNPEVKKEVAKGKSFVFKNITKELKENNDTYFVYDVNENDGYVIVSNEYGVNPILGYSDKGHLSNAKKAISPEFAYLLEDFQKKIEYVKSHAKKTDRTVSNRWSSLKGKSAATLVYSTAVAPLIKTNWNQSPYYNALCPSDAGGQAITGCVATAIAQVMKFWNYPTTGTGSHCYTDNGYGRGSYGNLCVDFGATTYKWADMPNELNSTSTPAQINAVATLMYHVGVGVNMGYSPSASGAWPTTNNALVSYFNYAPDTNFLNRNLTPNAEWSALMKNDLDKGYPVLYTGFYVGGAGHEWVCDGYDQNGLFHMNFGWGGGANGYFNLDDPNGFVSSQACYFNLRPSVSSPYNVYVKREGSTQVPKIHSWTNDTGTNVSLTPWASSPSMTTDTDGWYKSPSYTAKSLGTLFKYTDKQTQDFKYYSKNVWILLDASGNQKQVYNTDPRTSSAYPVISFISPELLVYNEGQSINIDVSAAMVGGTGTPKIYYTKSASGVPADPTSSSTLYTGPILTASTTTFKFIAIQDAQSSAIKSVTYTFNPVQTEFTIFVKRLSSTENPRIHAWSKETGTDVAITNTANWPNNLPYLVAQSTWYTYTTSKKLLGVLFKYADKQTQDFKYYSSTKWILLDASGNLKSVTDANPEPSGLTFYKNKQPNANGKYTSGITVTAGINRTIGCAVCPYQDFYTLDGSDPKTSITKVSFNSFIDFSIFKDTRLRAISSITSPTTGTIEYTNEIDESFVFETVATPRVKITTSPAPNSAGKYTTGQTVTVTLTVENQTPDNPKSIKYNTDGTDVYYTNSTTYTVPLLVTTNTIINAKVMLEDNGYRYSIFSEQTTKAIEFETIAPITIYVKKGTIPFGQEPKIHVWSKQTGTDVAITNTANWPSNLAVVTPVGNQSWYKYTVPNNSRALGCLFIFGTTQTKDFTGINADTWIEFNADGTVKSISNIAPYASTLATVTNMEKINTESLTLYPNPTNSYLNVNYPFVGSEQIEWSIFDIRGATLYSKKENSVNGFNTELNVSNLNLSPGTYILTLTSSKGKETKRFIVSP